MDMPPLRSQDGDVMKMYLWKIFSVTLTFEPMILKTYIVRGPTMRSICVSFGSNPLSRSGSMAFTGSLWSSLTAVDQ